MTVACFFVVAKAQLIERLGRSDNGKHYSSVNQCEIDVSRSKQRREVHLYCAICACTL